MIKIIHISDLHINSSDYNFNHKNLLEALISDLQNYIDENSIMIFSGDFLNQGGVNFSNEENPYDTVNLLLEEMTNNYSILKNRIFFVPGNHEVNRGDLNKFTDFPFKENLLKSKSNLKGFLEDFYVKEKGSEINGLNSYNEFSDIYFSDYASSNLTNLDNSFVIDVNNEKIGISCLNSSWLCYDDNDDGNIAIGVDQIENSLKFIEGVDLKICVIHHPLNYLQKKLEQAEIEKKIQNEYDIVLIGHTHEQKTDYINGIDGDYFISVGKSLTGENSELKTYKNGYSIIEYLKGNKVVCNFRKYDDDKKVFISNNDNALVDGVLELSINTKNNSTSDENNQVAISQNFNNYLNDAGAKFTSKSSKDIKLKDIYVPPYLERYDVVDNEERSNAVGTVYLLNEIKESRFKNVIVFGEENSGKTTFSKVLYKELLDDKKFLPVYIKGEDLKESNISHVDKLIRKNIEKQYENFTEALTSKVYLIIDDFKNSKLQFKYKRNLINNIIESEYNSLIIWDEYLTINEFLDVKNIDVNIFEILQFGSKKRFELIKKWSDLVNDDEYVDEKDKINNYYQLEKVIDSIIGKNLVPSFPIYVLIVLQSNELSTTTNLEQSTFGYYYDVLIKSAIGEKVKKNKEIEKIYSYLSELSYWLYEKKTLELSEDDMLKFHLYFNKTYDVETSFKEFNKVLIDTQILKFTSDEFYKFKYTYIYFYFIAKYLSDNIDEDDIKNDITDLSKKLFQSHAANIYMFLSHHSKSKYIINKVVENANSVFSDAVEMNFNDDVSNINNMIESTSESLSLEPSSYLKNKEDELMFKDSLVEDDSIDTSDKKNDSIDEIDFISQVNISYKSIEILGHILKNRYASLKAKDKNEIVEQIYNLSVRTLSSIFKVLLDGEDYLRKEILGLISEDATITESEKDSLAKMIMFNMLYMVSYSVIKKVSSSISSKDLKLTFNQVENDNTENNIIRLISIANKLDYSTDFPLSDTKLLKEDFKKNKLPYFILRRLGFNFLRLKPINEIDQQKVAQTLEISMHTQRSIEVTSKTKQ